MSVSVAAKETVEAILRNDVSVTIPAAMKTLTKIMNLCPLIVQQRIRDLVLRERETKSMHQLPTKVLELNKVVKVQ